jgi:FMN phosphatase YigB (HAD superfamily)
MTRPLLVCDCDEVLLHFAAPFARYLGDHHGIELRFDSFALAGNARHRETGFIVERAAIGELIQKFFDEAMHAQPAVDGAADALQALSQHFDIVILTNIRDDLAARRSAQITALGMPYPVVTNSGPKGPAVASLFAGRRQHGVFIDDLPPHHASVRQSVPDIKQLHMVADAGLRRLIPAAEHADRRIDIWSEALPWLIEMSK